MALRRRRTVRRRRVQSRKARIVRRFNFSRRYQKVRRAINTRKRSREYAVYKRLYVGEITEPIRKSGLKNMYLASFVSTGPSEQYPKRLSEMYTHCKVHKIVVKITPNFTANTSNTATTNIGPVKLVAAPLPSMPNGPSTEMKPNDTDYTYSTVMNLPGSKNITFAKGTSLVLFLKPKNWIGTGMPTQTTNTSVNGRFNLTQKAGWMSTASLNNAIPKYYDDYLASFCYAVSNHSATTTNGLSFQIGYYAYCSFKNDRSVVYDPYVKPPTQQGPPPEPDTHAVHCKDI